MRTAGRARRAPVASAAANSHRASHRQRKADTLLPPARRRLSPAASVQLTDRPALKRRPMPDIGVAAPPARNPRPVTGDPDPRNGARDGPPSGELIPLRDDRHVVIRPLGAADGAALADAFLRLSTESQQSRFGSAPRSLNAEALRHLVDSVDGVDARPRSPRSPRRTRGGWSESPASCAIPMTHNRWTWASPSPTTIRASG